MISLCYDCTLRLLQYEILHETHTEKEESMCYILLSSPPPLPLPPLFLLHGDKLYGRGTTDCLGHGTVYSVGTEETKTVVAVFIAV